MKVHLACPACESLDLYTCYADHQRVEVRCDDCGKWFDGRDGAPDPAVKEELADIRRLVEKVNARWASS